MKKNWTLEDIAMRSIDVFSKDISVKQAKKDLDAAYVKWREINLGEGSDWPKDRRLNLSEGTFEWGAMMADTRKEFAILKESLKDRRNAKKRLNHAITQVLTKPC